MNIKKFFTVFGSLFIIVLMVVSVAAVTYKGVSVGKAEKNEEELQLAKPTGSMNVLLIGRDRGGKLTDTIMIARLDNDKKTVNLLSIPRDTYVDGWKINALYSMGGVEYTVECVEDITGLKIDHYVSITTDVFREIIDLLGGVDFFVPQDMDYEDPYQDLYIHLKEGQQHLDGDHAEQLVRFRSYEQADIQRTSVQRDFIKALITQKKSMEYISKVDDIYRIVSSKIETDITIKTILENISTFTELDVTNNLNAFIMPNEPRYVSGISYVFVNDYELGQLLSEHFGLNYDEFGLRSGKHNYGETIGGDGYVSYDGDYDENTAWFEPETEQNYQYNTANESNGFVGSGEGTNGTNEGYTEPSLPEDSGYSEPSAPEQGDNAPTDDTSNSGGFVDVTVE